MTRTAASTALILAMSFRPEKHRQGDGKGVPAALSIFPEIISIIWKL
jgi:hypothetical protein